jgi:hypothetical protein
MRQITRTRLLTIGIVQLVFYSFIIVIFLVPGEVAYSLPFVVLVFLMLAISAAVLVVELIFVVLSFRKNFLISIILILIALAEFSLVYLRLFAGF